MSAAHPVRVTSLRGRVTKGLYAKGSKSEQEAIFIKTTKGRYVLRRKSGPAFDDPELVQYIKQEVECDGFIIGTTLLTDRIEIVY